MDWEGPDAVEEFSNVGPAAAREPTPQPSESEPEEPSEADIGLESDGAGTEDEYVADKAKPSAAKV